MANPNIEPESLDSGQRAALEHLRQANPNAIDFVEAERIGFISTGVRSQIDTALPGHQNLFQQALAANAGRGGPDTQIFYCAFETVYAPLLKQNVELDNDFITDMNVVLKDNIDPNNYRSRTPLSSAQRMLRNYAGPNYQLYSLLTAQRPPQQTARDDAQFDLDAFDTLRNAPGVQNRITQIQTVHYPAFANLTTYCNATPYSGNRINIANTFTDWSTNFIPNVGNLSALIPRLAACVTLTPAQITRLNALDAEINTIIGPPHGDFNRLYEIFTSDLRPFLNENTYGGLGYYGGIAVGDIITLNTLNTYFTTNANLIRDFSQMNQIVESRMDLANAMAELHNIRNYSLSPEVVASCDALITLHTGFLSGPRGATLSADDVNAFVVNNFRPGFQNILDQITATGDRLTAERDREQAALDAIDARLAALTSTNLLGQREILQRAFPGVNFDGLENVGRDRKSLETSLEYFETDNVLENLNSKYVAFNQAINSYNTLTGTTLTAAGNLQALITTEQTAINTINRNLSNTTADVNRSFRANPLDYTTLRDDKITELTALSHPNPLTPAQIAKAASDAEREVKDRIKSTIENTLNVEKARHQSHLDALQEIKNKANEFHEEFGKFVNVLRSANLDISNASLRVNFPGMDIAKIITDFHANNAGSSGFTPVALRELFINDVLPHIGNNLTDRNRHLNEYLTEIRNNISTSKSNETKLDLNDTEASKKIIATVLEEQNPTWTAEKCKQYATMILANDLDTITRQEDYQQLARRGSQELNGVLGRVQFRDRVIGLIFEDQNGNAVEPFRGLTPNDFSSWGRIKTLFDNGRLDLNAGFYLLAGFARMGGRNTEEYELLRRQLREMIINQVGVSDRVDDPAVVQFIEDTFNQYSQSAFSTVRAFDENYDQMRGEADTALVRALNMEIEELNDRYRRKLLDRRTYVSMYNDVLTRARERNLLGRIDFTTSTGLASFWNSPFAQKVRDRAKNLGVSGAKGTLRAGWGGFKMYMKGLWGGTKLGARGLFQAVATPIRAVKYPFIFAGGMCTRFANLFRSTQKQPASVIETARNDFDRVKDYVGERAEDVGAGIKEAGEDLMTDLRKIKFEKTDYADSDVIQLGEQISEFREEGSLKAVPQARGNVLNIADFRRQVPPAVSAVA